MHYLLLLEHDCDTMLESADNLGWDVATVSGDVVESTNYILQKGHNEHSVQGRGAAPKVMPSTRHGASPQPLKPSHGSVDMNCGP